MNIDLHLRRRTSLALVLLGLLFVSSGPGWISAVRRTGWLPIDYPNPQVDLDRCGRGGKPSLLCDPDQILSDRAADAIDLVLTNITDFPRNNGDEIGRRAPYEVAFAIMGKMQLESGVHERDQIQDFARYLHDSWGVGDKEELTGIVLAISMHDRVMYISTGAGVMGILTDANASAIIERMKEPLRNGEYDEALLQAALDIQYVLQGHSLAYEEDFYVEAAIITFFLAVFAYGIYGDYKKRRRFNDCKKKLMRIDKEKENQNNQRYESKSCPICLEDFEEGSDKEQEAEASVASPSASEINQSKKEGQRSPDLEGDGEEQKLIGQTSKKPGGPSTITLRCGHRFCKECIMSWLDKKVMCPICRDTGEDKGDDDQEPQSRTTRERPFPPATGGIEPTEAPSTLRNRHRSNERRSHTEKSAAGERDSMAAPAPQTEEEIREDEERRRQEERRAAENMFRLEMLRRMYPDFITTELIRSWSRGDYTGSLINDPSFLARNPANGAASGGNGARFSGFGGGSSVGGGGAGGSW